MNYRYLLTRSFLFGHGKVCWVMLNPSTADESTADPTITRVMGFSESHGYQSLEVVNLFAVRATEPSELVHLAGAGVDLVGPDNAGALSTAIAEAHAVVFAWGSSVPRPLWKWAAHQRAVVEHLCREHGHVPLCLGTNQDGQPKHPLYLSASEHLRPFVPVRSEA